MSKPPRFALLMMFILSPRARHVKNRRMALLLATAIGCCPFLGCGGGNEPTVIQPTTTYELSEQESQNRERAERALREQRQ
jgi:hypothetical protein